MGQCNEEFCAFYCSSLRKNIFPAKTHVNASVSLRCHTEFVSYEEACTFRYGHPSSWCADVAGFYLTRM